MPAFSCEQLLAFSPQGALLDELGDLQKKVERRNVFALECAPSPLQNSTPFSASPSPSLQRPYHAPPSLHAPLNIPPIFLVYSHVAPGDAWIR